MLYDESLSNILCFYNKGMGSQQVGLCRKQGKTKFLIEYYVRSQLIVLTPRD
uniref:Uncharacterized protein n=1 Tax=Siphoviridae sp. ct5jB2 TaxID=2825337 RepID=A0A8S5TTJ0_9CAUD|nr:MAG TPA: hypothetical protein [Siphoviridae sp. ct5jB2]